MKKKQGFLQLFFRSIHENKWDWWVVKEIIKMSKIIIPVIIFIIGLMVWNIIVNDKWVTSIFAIIINSTVLIFWIKMFFKAKRRERELVAEAL